jgi:hypothetical protein
MQLPCNPPTPIKEFFIQLEDGMAFARAGDEIFSDTQVLIRMGYKIIEANGLFELPC